MKLRRVHHFTARKVFDPQIQAFVLHAMSLNATDVLDVGTSCSCEADYLINGTKVQNVLYARIMALKVCPICHQSSM